MPDLKKQIYLKFLFFLSIAILLVAYFIQYVLGYQPCNLCVIERIPYVLAIVVLILNHILKKDQIFFSVLLLLIFTFSFLISIYHVGIEKGFIDESSICTSTNINLITKKEILNSLPILGVSCKDVAFRFLSLSLTTYNIFVSLLMFLISIKVYLINNGYKK